MPDFGTNEPWSAPIFVPSLGAPAYAMGRIALSFDGRELYFGSYAPGSSEEAHLWMARREKMTGKKR